MATTGFRIAASDAASIASTKTFSAAAINVRDNTKFVDTFDESKIKVTFKPTRTLVVGQSIPAGTLVPVGTPVDLSLTVKETLPLDGFKDIDPKILARFADKSVGDVTASYGADVQKVLERGDAGDYDTLPNADKAIVNEYMKTTYGVDAAADAAGAKNVYRNVKFLNDL